MNKRNDNAGMLKVAGKVGALVGAVAIVSIAGPQVIGLSGRASGGELQGGCGGPIDVDTEDTSADEQAIKGAKSASAQPYTPPPCPEGEAKFAGACRTTEWLASTLSGVSPSAPIASDLAISGYRAQSASTVRVLLPNGSSSLGDSYRVNFVNSTYKNLKSPNPDLYMGGYKIWRKATVEPFTHSSGQTYFRYRAYDRKKGGNGWKKIRERTYNPGSAILGCDDEGICEVAYASAFGANVAAVSAGIALVATAVSAPATGVGAAATVAAYGAFVASIDNLYDELGVPNPFGD